MRQRSYRLMIEDTVRFYAQHHKVDKKDRGSLQGMYKAVRFLIGVSPDVLESFELFAYAEEFNWLKNGDRECYFFESAETLQAVFDASFRLQNIDSIWSGESESFIIALPADSNLCAGGGGFLVTLNSSIERSKPITNDLFDCLGLRRPTFEWPEAIGDFMISVSYRDIEGEMALSRIVIDSGQVHKILACKDAREYQAVMDELNEFDYINPLEVDYEYQYQVSRIVLAFLVYRHAMPERIKKGFPEAKKSLSTSPITKNLAPIKVTGIQGDVTRASHYRSWHFRQLMNERFYKGEYKDKPVGSRIVFVRDAMVGAEIDPHTVT